MAFQYRCRACGARQTTKRVWQEDIAKLNYRVIAQQVCIRKVVCVSCKKSNTLSLDTYRHSGREHRHNVAKGRVCYEDCLPSSSPKSRAYPHRFASAGCRHSPLAEYHERQKRGEDVKLYVMDDMDEGDWRAIDLSMREGREQIMAAYEDYAAQLEPASPQIIVAFVPVKKAREH